MKKLLLFIVLISCFSACKQEAKMDPQIASFFDANGKTVPIETIEKNWNKRLTAKENIKAHITKFEIKHTLDQKTRSSPMILLGITNLESVKTACVLIPFKEGYQLGKIMVTCVNCGPRSTPILYDGKWACQKYDEHSEDCTKMITDKDS